MLKEIRAALRKADLGFIARIEPVHYPDRIIYYVTHYLHGTAQQSRYGLDFRVRLWSASKNARVANADCQVLTQWSRIQRLKMAAYFALRRWKSRQEAHDCDKLWQYRARPFLADTKLRVYHHECDYVREWGPRWSPRASGVRLLYPHLNPDGNPPFCYQYLERPTDVEKLAALQRIWDPVEHFAPRKFRRRASALGLRNQWPDDLPLLIADIARIRLACLNPKLSSTVINIVPVIFPTFSTCSKRTPSCTTLKIGGA